MHSSSSNTLAAVHTAWTTFINGVCSGTLNALWPNEVSATETMTDQLDPLTGKNVAQARSAINQVGTGAGATLPGRVSIIVGLRTALPTRAGRGRMSWPGMDAGHLTAQGLWVAADVTSLAAAFSNGLATFQATSTPVIYHRSSKTGTTVISTAIPTVPGSQRRRTNKVTGATVVDPI